MSAIDTSIKTRFFILSDTHGEALRPESLPTERVDVAIHCGDLSEESKLQEFEISLQVLRNISADLKLVIPGNHDFSLDTPMFRRKLQEAGVLHETALVKATYGDFGEAKQLFLDAKKDGIIYLEEGTHNFVLSNGAKLKVFASPFTPSTNDWGFQYHPQEERQWSIEADTDVVITHGPPHGILDRTAERIRAGCPSLFAAVAEVQPRLHCFGHIHNSWGGKMVGWREYIGENPSHFTAVDSDRSFVVGQVSGLAADAACCHARHSKEENQGQTLFINAAIEGTEKRPYQPSWIVEIDLNRA